MDPKNPYKFAKKYGIDLRRNNTGSPQFFEFSGWPFSAYINPKCWYIVEDNRIVTHTYLYQTSNKDAINLMKDYLAWR